MHADIENNRLDIDRLCRKYRVQRLDLFGSSARPRRESPPEDVDLLVEFQPMRPSEHADCYFGLLEDLIRLLHRPVDLAEIRPIRNPFFLEAIKATRVPLYAAA